MIQMLNSILWATFLKQKCRKAYNHLPVFPYQGGWAWSHRKLRAHGTNCIRILLLLLLVLLFLCFLRVYSFPRAAISNYHKLDGRKQQNWFLLFWRSEVWNSGVGRAMLTLRYVRQRVSWHILGFGGSWQSKACVSLTPVSACVVTWSSLCVFYSLLQGHSCWIQGLP